MNLDAIALERHQLVIDDESKAWHQGVHGGVGRHAGRISQDLLAPHQPGLGAQVDDVLEEATEQRQSNPLA